MCSSAFSYEAYVLYAGQTGCDSTPIIEHYLPNSMYTNQEHVFFLCNIISDIEQLDCYRHIGLFHVYPYEYLVALIHRGYFHIFILVSFII